MEVLGIDIGGPGIKGAPVDVDTGVLTKERIKVLTPKPNIVLSTTQKCSFYLWLPNRAKYGRMSRFRTSTVRR